MTAADSRSLKTDQDQDETTRAAEPAAVSEREARQTAEAAREAEWRKPSFGKQLFLGRLRLDLIDPWPTPSAESVAEDGVEVLLGRMTGTVESHCRVD